MGSRATVAELDELRPILTRLKEATVLLPDGEPDRLGRLWSSEGPTLMVFLRHFGCIGCDENVTRLLPALEELCEAGARAILIGNGTAAQLASFVTDRELDRGPALIVTDPDRITYAALSLSRSLYGSLVLGPRDFLSGSAKGYRQGGLAGDPIQQGGTLIVDAKGAPRYLYRNESISDHAPVGELKRQLRRLVLGPE